MVCFQNTCFARAQEACYALAEDTARVWIRSKLITSFYSAMEEFPERAVAAGPPDALRSWTVLALQGAARDASASLSALAALMRFFNNEVSGNATTDFGTIFSVLLLDQPPAVRFWHLFFWFTDGVLNSIRATLQFVK